MRNKRTSVGEDLPKVGPALAETPPVGPSVPECLSPDHLRQIELASAKVEAAKLTRKIAEQDVIIAELVMEKKQRALVQESTNQQTAIKVRNDLVTSFKQIYSITDSLAYDPDTGKIYRK